MKKTCKHLRQKLNVIKLSKNKISSRLENSLYDEISLNFIFVKRIDFKDDFEGQLKRIVRHEVELFYSDLMKFLQES